MFLLIICKLESRIEGPIFQQREREGSLNSIRAARFLYLAVRDEYSVRAKDYEIRRLQFRTTFAPLKKRT
jgi:hypothetical protein